MNREECRVAVIGGGLSGLAAAERLQKKGYKTVTVFEGDNRLGGKLHTIWYKDKSYEFGAMFGLPAQKQLRSLIKSLNIKVDGPKLSRANYDASGNRVMQIPREELGDFIDELDRFPEVLGKYRSLESVNIHKLEPSLMLPFSVWCDINSFRVLKKVYRQHFSSYGLGDIEDVPAVYVLKVLNYDNIMSFMDLPEFFTWKDGVSSLIECLMKKIRDIRLGQWVRKITLGSNGELLLHTDFERLEFDKVIITAPIEQFSQFYGEDQEMKDFLSSIKYNNFSLYAFIGEKISKGCGCVLENLSLDRRGHMIIWNSRWEPLEGEGLVTVYAYDKQGCCREESLGIIKEDLCSIGIKNPRLYQCRHWKQGPHVNTTVLQRGFYEKLEDMQGKYSIFLAGEIMSGVSMENCLKYVNYLINKYF